MKLKRNQKGFTLIEILLVVTILGFMLAVILPRGLRTSVDAKYSLLRKHCTELAGYANQWVEEQMLAQDADSQATTSRYYQTLTESNGLVPAGGRATWIANNTFSHWNKAGSRFGVFRRKIGGVDNSRPEISIEGMIDPGMIPRNPFNGTNVFLSTNLPTNKPIPGAIACSYAVDDSLGVAAGSYHYYALIFQGTESKVGNPDAQANGVDYHAGMNDNNIAGLRNGVFLAKVKNL